MMQIKVMRVIDKTKTYHKPNMLIVSIHVLPILIPCIRNPWVIG